MGVVLKYRNCALASAEMCAGSSRSYAWGFWALLLAPAPPPSLLRPTPFAPHARAVQGMVQKPTDASFMLAMLAGRFTARHEKLDPPP